MIRRLAFALAALLAFSPWSAHAGLMALQRANGPAPYWVLRGGGAPQPWASLDEDFANAHYWQQGLASGLSAAQINTTTRASTETNLLPT